MAKWDLSKLQQEQARIAHQQRYDATQTRAYADETWLNVVIDREGKDPITINVRGSLQLIQHITKEAKVTGYVTLWNDNECVVVNADEVSTIRAVKLTTDGE